MTSLDVIVGIITIIGAISAFIGALWYWGLDHKTQSYDDNLRREIMDDAAFSGIRSAARPEFIVTSDSEVSKLTTILQKSLGRIQTKPDKIVPIEGDNLEARQIEMIRERTQYIPGKNILSSELFSGIRNFYAYKLALTDGDIRSNVVEYYQSRFQQSSYSKKIADLGKTENYSEISLKFDQDYEGDRDPLNDVFLDLVEAAEKYCVAPHADVDDKIEAIENCRNHLMLSFYVLWAQRLKGVKVRRELSEDDCLTLYRSDVKNEVSWGYWLLPDGDCDVDEFRRMRHLAWSISDLIEYHWSEVDYSELYPIGESITEMDPVGTPFFLALQDEREFRGGGPSSKS